MVPTHGVWGTESLRPATVRLLPTRRKAYLDDSSTSCASDGFVLLKHRMCSTCIHNRKVDNMPSLLKLVTFDGPPLWTCPVPICLCARPCRCR